MAGIKVNTGAASQVWRRNLAEGPQKLVGGIVPGIPDGVEGALSHALQAASADLSRGRHLGGQALTQLGQTFDRAMSDHAAVEQHNTRLMTSSGRPR